MRKMFPGFYLPTEEDVARVWRDAAVVLDTNVLLSLYRYTPKTAQSLLNLLRAVSGRLWVPYQVAHEFHMNRLKVITDQTKQYTHAKEAAEELLRSLEDESSHPFVQQNLLGRVRTTLGELNTVLAAEVQSRDALIRDDTTLSLLTESLEGRVGAPPIDEKKMRDLARARCDCQTPPGFRDKKKDQDHAIGDAVLWLQLLDHFKETKKDVIFVTNDQKDDWWQNARGQHLPHPALVSEFNLATGQSILFYSAPKFLTEARKHLQSNISQEVIREVETVREPRNPAVRRRKFKDEGANMLADIAEHLHRHRKYARAVLRAVQHEAPEVWQGCKSPLDAPAGVRARLDDIVRSCRCIRRIAHQLDAIVPAGFYASLEKIEPHRVPGTDLLLEFWQLPESALSLLCTSAVPSGNGDGEGAAA